ncbi:MAG: hypothetical protein PVJ09_00550 [Candidatus Woesebacteria bacterium]|jgi:hypothetical protein
MAERRSYSLEDFFTVQRRRVSEAEKNEQTLAKVNSPYTEVSQPLIPKEIAPYISPKELDFWQQRPPEEIILATGSLRKIFMMLYQMEGFVFPLSYERVKEKASGNGSLSEQDQAMLNWDLIYTDSPPEFQDIFFPKHMPNGDGKLQEKTLVAYFQGIPVYAEPTDGEGDSNEPLDEAFNKIRALASKYDQLNKDIIIVATDAVSYADDGSDQRRHLGKPMNMPGYDADAFDPEQYIRDQYPVGSRVVNINAVAAIRTGRGQEGDDDFIPRGEHRGEVCHHTIITEDNSEGLIVHRDCGGGGVPQQLIDWDNIEMIRGIMGNEQAARLKDNRVIKWALVCAITGSPWYAIEEAIEELRIID